MPRLVILDGNSLLYRGFYAMRYLSTADGTPTNAVHTFVNMLLLILEREKPDKIYAAFDPPVATFRHVEMESYKANRKETPDDLKPQRALARQAAEAFRVPVVEVDGYEADDVVGTLARLGKEQGYEVLIVSGDGDTLQLVDDSHGPVKVMITVKGVTDTVLYDEKAVVDRYGITASQIPDFKGLKGDSSDNLPGVPGIGEKGASRLLQQYKSVEGIIEHAAELPDRTRKAIEENVELARQCKRLATIVCDVPLPEWVNFAPDYPEIGPDYAAVRELFDRLEFKNLLRRIQGMEAVRRAKNVATAPEPVLVTERKRLSGIRRTLTDSRDIEALVRRLSESGAHAGVHLHTGPVTAGFHRTDLHGIAVATGEGAWYVPRDHMITPFRSFLESAAFPKYVYDLKVTAGVLRQVEDMNIAGVTFDPLLAAYLLNATRASYPLHDIAAAHAGIDLLADPADPQGVAMDQAAAVAQLADILRPKLVADGLLDIHDTIELPLSPVIARMEAVGVTIDAGLLREVSKTMSVQIGVLETEIHALAGGPFAIGSTRQLQEVLFEKLKLPAQRKTKTGYSTGAEVLEDLEAKGHEIAGKILAWRELTKLKSTYADTLPTLCSPVTGKVHTSLSQTVASSGRLSSSNPNLQNIPIRSEVGREIRKAFVATPGRVLVSTDYSQIELRVFAHMSGEPALAKAFQDDDDIHVRTARLIFGVPPGQPVTGDQRRQAKTINFAVLYGAGPFRVSNELGIPQSAARELIKSYYASYPSVRRFAEETLEAARTSGYVQTLLGRRRYVPDVNSANYQFRQAAEREAGNMPVQGTAADIMKLAMLKIDAAMATSGLTAQMVLQVHDELLFEAVPDEVPRLASLVRECMESAYPLSVRLRADVKTGHNWWEVTPVESAEAAAFEEG
ncbi:MAG: DNA polymerase I [Capsulimonadaceae bacterium]